MIYETRKCAVCGTFFPRDGKRTVCSVECYEYRRKFVYSTWKKKKKICRICNKKITDPDRKTICSTECVFIAETQNRKKAYAVYKSNRYKNSIKNGKRRKRLRTLDKKPQKAQEAKGNSPLIPELHTTFDGCPPCLCRS